MESLEGRRLRAKCNLRLAGIYDQTDGCSVRIIPTSFREDDFFLVVRPKGRRRDYRVLLSDMARKAIVMVAMQEAKV